MIITITGDLGSGKTTIAKALSEEIGFIYFSSGEIQREIAEEMQITTLELNQKAFNDKDIDRLIDGEIEKLNYTNLNYVVDSRLGWHFIKESYKIYTTVDIDLAAERIFKGELRKSEDISDVKTIKENLITRRKLEVDRFKEIYDIDILSKDNYDLIIDTSDMDISQIIQLIIHKI